MFEANSFFSNILSVLSSNIISLIDSIIIGLVVPVILGATNYGYYRMFILYSSYTAFLHFGFVDGVLLKLGGRNYNNLNKKYLRSIVHAFFILELIISIIIVIISLLLSNPIYSFLCMLVGINTFFQNMSTYYQFLSQATMNFTGYSIRSIVPTSLTIILTLILWLFYKIKILETITYKEYIYVSLFATIIMFIMGVYAYSDSTFGLHKSLYLGFKKVISFCKIGIYLTIAYQVSNLIMIIDNQMVSIFFKANTYGEYSFSYSMTNTAITILGTVATVLLPHLKRDTFHHMISIYHKMISSIMLIVYLSLLAYFPLCVLVKIIIPEYVQSLSYLKIFLPELGITCSVTMITFNYYNALGKSKFYFYMSLVVLTISIVIDSVMYMLFHDPVLIAFGSFISIFIWYLASEYFLVKWYHVQWMKNLIYMMLMISSFFVASMVPNLIVGLGIYLIAYVIISWSMFRVIIKKNVNVIIKKVNDT